MIQKDGAIKEAVFVMEGKFKVGFKHLVEEFDMENPHWHEFNKGKFHSNINVISDYSMLYMRSSDLAYLCTEKIKGYKLEREDWIEIIEDYPKEMYDGLMKRSKKKYYNMFMAVMWHEYPQGQGNENKHKKGYRDAKKKHKEMLLELLV